MGKPWSQMTRHEQDGRGTARWKKLRALVLRTSDVCWMCGRGGADTVDHLIPLALGGQNVIENLRPAHGRKTPFCPGNYGRKVDYEPVETRTRVW